MKLLLCLSCSDLVKLQFEERSCLCGRVRGAYKEDGDSIWYNGRGYLMGLNNGKVVALVAGNSEIHPDLFLIPDSNSKIEVRNV